MPARLLIHYRGPDAALAYVALDDRGRALQAPQRAHAPPSNLAAGAEVVVIVPGEDVMLAHADVASRDREQLARAVPFALEEQFAEAVEHLHVAFVAAAGGGQDVAAVRRDTLRAWLDDLATRGVRPDHLLPETLVLPLAPAGARVIVGEGRGIVRLGPVAGFVAPVDALVDLLRLAEIPRDAAGRIPLQLAQVDGETADFDPEFAIEPWREISQPIEAFIATTAGATLRTLPNLATGAFAPSHRGEPALRWWRFAGWMAAASLVLAFAFAVVDRWVLARRVEALNVAMEQVYREVYPDGRRVPDPAGRMRAEFGQIKAGAVAQGAMGLLAKVAPVLAQDTHLVVRGLEYRAGALDINLLAQDVQSLDGVRERAAAVPGLSARLESASTSERGAEGRLRVAMAGAR